MRAKVLVFACLAACGALAAGKKLPECSFTVTPRRGESQVSRSGGGLLRSLNSRSTDGSSSKTITRSMKWFAEVRIREDRPAKLELKVYHIGEVDGGKSIKLLKSEDKTLELNEDGRAAVEFTSPTTRLSKSRSSSYSSSSSGFRSTKKTISGERVIGCVMQLFADGELLKSWSSDTRWASAAKKTPFAIADLSPEKTGRIGIR